MLMNRRKAAKKNPEVKPARTRLQRGGGGGEGELGRWGGGGLRVSGGNIT
jgi:hypothetical protein